MKNKKFIALALAAIMIAGCGNKKKADTSKVKDTQPKTAQTETANAPTEKTEETTAPQTNSGASEKKPTASSSSTSSSTSRKAETVKATSNKPSTASSSSSGKKASTPAKTSTPAKKPSTSSNKPASKPSKPSKPNKPSKPVTKKSGVAKCIVWLKDKKTGKVYTLYTASKSWTGDEYDREDAKGKAEQEAWNWGKSHESYMGDFADNHNIDQFNWGTKYI